MKVAIAFYCTKTKKNYPKGSEYNGKRADLKHLMVGYTEPKETKDTTKDKLEKK